LSVLWYLGNASKIISPYVFQSEPAFLPRQIFLLLHLMDLWFWFLHSWTLI
jgi:hypothetical protein